MGEPYPPYEAPAFADFAELVEHMAREYDKRTAFVLADGSQVPYDALAGEIGREVRALDSASAGRFVEVRDADPVRFAVRYLAAVSSGRCAVLCEPGERQRAALAGGDVPAGVCTIAASSGTTGDPKAIMLTQAGMLADLHAGCQLYKYPQGARLVKLLPYTHLFGLVCDLLAPLAAGAAICIPHSAATFALELPGLAPTMLNVPPLMAQTLLGLLERKEGYCLPTLRKLLCGGAALSSKVSQGLRLHGIQAFGCYGATECSPCISVNRDAWHKDGSCGVPLACNEVRISAAGELLVRGVNVMAGYLGEPALTAQRIDARGWYHTHDRGRIDADGFVWVDGRTDGVIVRPDATKLMPR